MACGGDFHSDYDALRTGAHQAVLARRFNTTGDCWCVVHRSLSYHSRYHGSNLQAIGALQCGYRQSGQGTWGDAYLCTMFDLLGRIGHPLAAFLALRSVPRLIREQRPDGLWEESWGRFPPGRETGSLMILTALAEFGFLDALRPG